MSARHGTPLGYRIDGCRCDDCRFAVARDMKVYELRRIANGGAPLMVDPIGCRRRLRALMALGWPRRTLAVEAGYSPGGLTGVLSGRRTRVTPEFRDRIVKMYDRLSMTPGPSQRTRAIALRSGWAPPLGWNDIDNDEVPVVTDADEGCYRAADLAAEWAWLRRSGESIEQAARQLGVTVGAIEKALERVGKVSAA